MSLNIKILHNSHEIKYRNPFGAVPCGSSVRLRVDVCSPDNNLAVALVLSKDNCETQRIYMERQRKEEDLHIFTTEIIISDEPGLLWYYFEVLHGEEPFEGSSGAVHYCGNNRAMRGGNCGIYNTVPPAFQITVYSKDYKTPDWYKDGIMYQIFVDRFYNGNKENKISGAKKNSFIYSNWEDRPMYIKDNESGRIARWDFFGGNLRGIIEKLPYLRELGVSIIYLNPIFEASSNHKYDTGNYMNIDPMFGDNDTFKLLCKKAEQNGIAIILDGVFSHTGSDSVYFNKYGNYTELGAWQSKDSPYYSWYRFKTDDRPKGEVAGDGIPYECWWGIDTLPNVDEMNPSYLDFIIRSDKSVLKHWLKLGAKGWRLDVADELPDEFIKLFKSTMGDQDPESVLIGEVWEDASNKMSYGKRREYLLGDELDAAMNYPFRNILVDFILENADAAHTHEALMSLYENYPLESFYSAMNVIGTHDIPRILTILGEAPEEQHLTQRQKEDYYLSEEKVEIAVERLKLLSLLQMTFPGVPCIYYGDEAGVEGYRDPLNRSTYPWGKENKELLKWYRTLTSVRRKYDMLSSGSWHSLFIENDVYGYIRKIEEGKDVFGRKKNDGIAVILVNRSTDKFAGIKFDMSDHFKGLLKDVLRNDNYVYTSEGILTVNLKPLEGRLLISG